MPSTTAIAFASIAVAYIFLRVLLDLTQDANEPPTLKASLPFFGPLISMIREKSLFYVRLRDKYKLPIYTLRLPFSRVYIVNATELLPAVQKQWRTLSFTPILAAAGPGPMGMSKEAGEILHRDMASDENSVVAFTRAILPVLAPGETLDQMNRRAVEVMAETMDHLRYGNTGGRAIGEGTVVDFWAWTHHEILMATTEAVYGPGNPYREKNIEEAWNKFEPSYLTFALSPFKAILAPQAFQSREILAAAWVKYLEAGWHEKASGFAKTLYDHHRSHGFSVDDIARAEIGQSFAVIGTTGPTAWWMMYHIFSDREVLADVRGELDGLVKVTPDADGEVCEINLACIRNRCPILLSTFKETLRHRSLGTAVRICLDDHMLDGRFLLKKGGIIIIPQLVQHTSTSAWGADADKFDHLRFVKGAGGKKINHTAFRAFGGGHTLCPGRHFSTTEMMAFVALMVLQYDIVPLGDSKHSVGNWTEPTWKKSPVVATFPVPDEDFKVRILPRDSRRWKVKFEGEVGGAKAMEITEEDIKHF